jgi:hypothetical protein
MAILYRSQGKLRQAEALYQHALRIFEQAFGPEHFRVKTCWENYVELLQEINDTT